MKRQYWVFFYFGNLADEVCECYAHQDDEFEADDALEAIEIAKKWQEEDDEKVLALIEKAEAEADGRCKDLYQWAFDNAPNYIASLQRWDDGEENWVKVG